MDLRVQLIQDYEEGESIAGLAEIYGVARKTVYKWLARHDAEGVAGLADHSRVPLHFPGIRRSRGRRNRPSAKC